MYFIGFKIFIFFLLIAFCWLFFKNFKKQNFDNNEIKNYRVLFVLGCLNYLAVLCFILFDFFFNKETRFLIFSILQSLPPIWLFAMAVITIFNGSFPSPKGNLNKNEKPFVFYGIFIVALLLSIQGLIFNWGLYNYLIWNFTQFIKHLY